MKKLVLSSFVLASLSAAHAQEPKRVDYSVRPASLASRSTPRSEVDPFASRMLAVAREKAAAAPHSRAGDSSGKPSKKKEEIGEVIAKRLPELVTGIVISDGAEQAGSTDRRVATVSFGRSGVFREGEQLSSLPGLEFPFCIKKIDHASLTIVFKAAEEGSLEMKDQEVAVPVPDFFKTR